MDGDRPAARSPATTPARCAACSASRPAPRSASPRCGEIGNIVGTSYINALARDDRHRRSSRRRRRPRPTCSRAIVAVRARRARRRGSDVALLLDSELRRRGRGLLAVVPARARTQGGVRAAARAPGPRRLMAETMVRMGELAASPAPGDVLVSLGLGSCIGLALRRPRARHRRAGARRAARVERRRRARRGKFADRAVPGADRPRRSRSGGRATAARGRARRRRAACSARWRRAASALEVGPAQRGRRARAARVGSASPSSPPRPAATAGARSASTSARARDRARGRRRGCRTRAHAQEVVAHERQVLSPDAIAALVDAATRGPTCPRTTRPRRPAAPPRMRTVDFTRPTKFTRRAGAAAAAARSRRSAAPRRRACRPSCACRSSSRSRPPPS